MSSSDASQYPVLIYDTLRPTSSEYDLYLSSESVSERTVELTGFSMYNDKGKFAYVKASTFAHIGIVVATLVELGAEYYDSTLRELDNLYGFYGDDHALINEANRILHTFELDGEQVSAWLYVMSETTETAIVNTLRSLPYGDWLEIERNKKQ